MFRQICESDAKKASQGASPKDQQRKLPKFWGELEAKVWRLDADGLISISEHGFNSRMDGSAELYAVVLEDGRVMLDVSVHGNILVDVEYLSESLQEDVRRILSLLPEGEVVA